MAALVHGEYAAIATKPASPGLAASVDYDSDETDDKTVLISPNARDTSTSTTDSQEDSNMTLVVPQCKVAEELESTIQPSCTFTVDDIDDLNDFVLRPAPEGLIVKCQVTRERQGMERSVYPDYYLFLEREGRKNIFLLGARKRKKN